MLRPSPPESSALGRLLQLPPMLGWLLRRHCAHWGVGYSGSLLHKAVSRPLGPMRSCRRPCRGSRSFDPCRIPQVVPAFQGWDALQVPRHPPQRPGATGASHPTQPEQSFLQVACTSAPPNACKALGVLRSWGSEAQHAGYPHPHQCHWLGIRPLGLHPWPLDFFGPQLKDQLESPKVHCPTASNLLPASLNPSLQLGRWHLRSRAPKVPIQAVGSLGSLPSLDQRYFHQLLPASHPRTQLAQVTQVTQVNLEDSHAARRDPDLHHRHWAPRRSSGTAAQRARAGARKGALSPRPRRLHHCGGLSTSLIARPLAPMPSVAPPCPVVIDSPDQPETSAGALRCWHVPPLWPQRLVSLPAHLAHWDRHPPLKFVQLPGHRCIEPPPKAYPPWR
mmetsp:Transcript_51882/g.105499  ORF Transcript_51882/g.105499 Transcript_51882/m.105499 type:complete len:391 (+) Transcript_51882:112-1284(+)